MKYRALRLDELEEVKDQFIRFLASNSITAQDWEKLKEEEPTKANKLIEMFSDIVFESVLKNLKYLEQRFSKELRLFRCGKDKIELIGLRVAQNINVDFAKNQSTEQMMQAVQAAPAGGIKMFSAEKTYKPERAKELFKMMENGALISDGNLFETLLSLKK